MTEEKKSVPKVPAPELKKTKPRSPGYPAIPIQNALERAKALHKDLGRHEADEASIYKMLGYKKGRSGTSAVILAALRAFGLIEKSGTGSKISALANRIFIDNREDQTEKKALIREAALKPAMHQYMLEKYGEAEELPADSVMAFHLEAEKGFTKSGAKQFIEEYRATMAFCGPSTGAKMSSDGQDDHEEETHMETHIPAANAGRTTTPPGMREVPIPIAGAVWPSIKAPFPMTESAWKQMLAVLTAMKPGLVVDEELKDL